MDYEKVKIFLESGNKYRRKSWREALLYVKKEGDKLFLFYKSGDKIEKIPFVKDGLNMQTDWEEVLI